MPHSRSTSRRTVCKRAGSLVVALGGIGTIAESTGARSGDAPTDEPSVAGDRDPDAPARLSAETAGNQRAPGTDDFECYRGVVDRIVDDRFVVILLEEEGEVVGEVVEPRSELPPLSESDRVLVVLRDGEPHTVIPLP